MIDILKKYYLISPNSYSYYNDGIIFMIDGVNYYFTVSLVFDDDLYYCLDLVKDIKYFHSVVYNIYGQIISDKYILFKINCVLGEIEVDDIIKVSSLKKNGNRYISMRQFWNNKIDYLEHQVNELSFNEEINYSFDYYIGICEILLLYLGDNDSNNLSLAHKSMTSLNVIDYYNPLNMSVDLYYKDIASFIRLTNRYDILKKILTENKLDEFEYRYLFVRMVFPFEYLEEIDNILIDNKSSNKLISIINKNKQYEEYIMKMQELFGINVFYWLKKE